MPVTTPHPEYTAACKRWSLIRAIVNNDAKSYLHSPDSNDITRSFRYKEDAILTNFTNLTKMGLTGLIFRRDLKCTLPPELGYLEDNTTGSGISLEQFSKTEVSATIELGRYGMLVDFDQRAYIKPYCAESIINWKTININGEDVLSLVVLKEEVLETTDDIFDQTCKTQYRVLRLNENIEYIQEIYNEDSVLESAIEITDFNGNRLNRIPFFFAGSENNDWWVDYQPLYDLAVLNLGHYRNSADYEESIFICGQPYPVIDIGEQDPAEFKAQNPNGVLYGSRVGLVLQGGNAQLLQANANQLVAQAMREKLEQAAAIGARLISPSGGRETAEAAKIRYGSQHSALYNLAHNVESAIENALKACCVFMGADESLVEFDLNTDFYDESADANLIAQMILMTANGQMTVQELRDYGIKTGFISSNVNTNPEEI